MSGKKSLSTRRQFLAVLRELRGQLHDIDQKLDHLIRSHRHFYSLYDKDRELHN